MAVNISWYVENRVILAHVEGVVDDEGMHAFNTTIGDFLENGQAPIHLIVDTTEIKQFPTNLRTLRKSQAYLTHSNMGWIIVINTNPMLNFLVHVLTSVAHVKERTVKTFDEGKHILASLDASLPL